MRKQLILATFLGTLIAAPTLHAQTPPAGKEEKARMMKDCSKAADPKTCEDRQSKVRGAVKKAEEQCKGKAGPEHRACMRENVCAQAKDPAQCKARAEKFGEYMKACEGRKDDELRKCMRDERAKHKGEKK